MTRKLIPLALGIAVAVLHFTLAHYVKIDTSPEEIKELSQSSRKILSVEEREDSGAKKRRSFAELVNKIRALKLFELYRQHLEKHYGKNHVSGADIVKGHRQPADPDEIIRIYETLYEIQRLEIAPPEVKAPEVSDFWEKFRSWSREKRQPAGELKPEVLDKLHSLVKLMEEKPLSPAIPKEKHGIFRTACAFALGFLLALFYGWARQIYTKILLGMIAGAIFGWLFGPAPAAAVYPLGAIFIRLIKMVVVPLVLASLTLGVLSLGDVRKLGRIGGKTIAYYLVTTACAITIGLVLANIIRPGNYVGEEERERYQEEFQKTVVEKAGERRSLEEMLLEVVPVNPIEAMARANMLQIIFFALLFGVVLASVAKDKREAVAGGLGGVNDAMIQMVVWIMEVAPLGVFGLMADVVARAGVSILKALTVYALVVIAGLILHVLVVYASAVRIFARMSLTEFLKKVYSVQLIAFSTSSSAATLPVSMRCAEEKLGVSPEISSFVLPLGATINMDGTALYQGVAAVFIAQVYGIPLDLVSQLTILLTATLASIGTAAVPGAGIVMLVMVLESIGVPAIGIALILGVDRILDMCRTTINVTGDLSAAVVVQQTERKRSSTGGDSR